MYASLLQYTIIIIHIIKEDLNYLILTLNLSHVCVVLTESKCLSLFKTITMSIASRFVLVSSFPCSNKSG